jgi:LPXTG-site transpeptidase (sortase) family protein
VKDAASAPARARSRTNLAGSLLILAGVGLLIYAALWQLGLAPGSRVTVPEPVALAGGIREASVPTLAPTPLPLATAVPTVAPIQAEPTSAAQPTVAPTAVPVPVFPTEAPDPADRTDREALATMPKPGYAARLTIPSIQLDAQVEQAGIVLNVQREPEWQTLPFVGAHYGDLTALVGAVGNAVIAGHVVTLNEGNVFRNLYQVDLGDEIHVWTTEDVEHVFSVVQIKLVKPDDVSVFDETPDRTLTLITCGGEFDPVRREFSDRLIVVAKPAAVE